MMEGSIPPEIGNLKVAAIGLNGNKLWVKWKMPFCFTHTSTPFMTICTPCCLSRWINQCQLQAAPSSAQSLFPFRLRSPRWCTLLPGRTQGIERDLWVSQGSRMDGQWQLDPWIHQLLWLAGSHLWQWHWQGGEAEFDKQWPVWGVEYKYWKFGLARGLGSEW